MLGRNRMDEVQWQPPPSNVIKLNTDASFDQSSHEAGLGVVAKDDLGRISFSASTKVTNIKNPLQVVVMVIFLINGDVLNFW